MVESLKVLRVHIDSINTKQKKEKLLFHGIKVIFPKVL